MQMRKYTSLEWKGTIAAADVAAAAVQVVAAGQLGAE